MPSGLCSRHSLGTQGKKCPLSLFSVATDEDPRLVHPLETGDSHEAKFTCHRGHVAIELETSEELGFVGVAIDPVRGPLRGDACIAAPLVSEIDTYVQ